MGKLALLVFVMLAVFKLAGVIVSSWTTIVGLTLFVALAPLFFAFVVLLLGGIALLVTFVLVVIAAMFEAVFT